MTQRIRHLFALLGAVLGSIPCLPRVILEPSARSESRATCQMWTPKIRTERQQSGISQRLSSPLETLGMSVSCLAMGRLWPQKSHLLFQAHPMPCLPRKEKRRGKGEGRKATSRLLGKSVASWAMDNRGPEMFPVSPSL